MTQEAICVGIDVAKAGMDVSIRPTDDIWEVSNDEAGIRQLVSHLNSCGTCHRAAGGVGRLGTAPCDGSCGRGDAGRCRQPKTGARLRQGHRKAGQDRHSGCGGTGLAHFGEAVRSPVRPLRDAESQLLNSLVARRHQLMTILDDDGTQRRSSRSSESTSRTDPSSTRPPTIYPYSSWTCLPTIAHSRVCTGTSGWSSSGGPI